MSKFTIAALLISGAVALSAPFAASAAVAQEDSAVETRQQSVMVRASSADAATRARLQDAARRVCAREDDQDLSAYRAEQTCRAAAYNDAMSRLHAAEIARAERQAGKSDAKLALAAAQGAETTAH